MDGVGCRDWKRGWRRRKTKDWSPRLTKVLDFLKEPRAGGWAAEWQHSWEVAISGQGFRTALCVYRV